MRGSNYPGNYTNPCLTMHQPWASLLVYGIKRIEGRSWPAPIRGRLWIHAASKVPEDDTIKAMEDFYREIYAVNGITELKFPEHYPVSRLVGCIDVVGCVRREELANWEVVPEGVRLEGQTDFCWLCEQPKKLIIPFEMRGNQGVYNLEKRIYEAAVRGIIPVEGPLPVKFPLPNPRDLFSLKPGSISVQFPASKTSQVEKSPGLSAAIAGARAAATQYSKKDHNSLANASYNRNIPDSRRIDQSKEKSMEDTKLPSGSLDERNNERSLLSHENEQKSHFEHQQNSGSRNQLIPTDLDQHTAASSKHKSLEATKLRFGSLGENNEVISLSHEDEQKSHFEHHRNSGSHSQLILDQHTAASSKHKSLEATKLRFGSLGENNEVISLSHEDEQKSHFEHHRNSGSHSQLIPTILNQHSVVSSKHKSMEATKLPSGSLDERNNEVSSLTHENEQRSHFEHHRNSGSRSQSIPATSNQHSAASPKLFATALRGLRLS